MEVKEIEQRLKEGNARFMQDKLEGKLQDSARRKDLVDGQSPFAIILSCADSRVVPELAFDTGLGELFVVRVAGNVANTSSIASMEYAVAVLKTKVLVVMGHQSCGAVGAAIKGGDNGHNLNHLLAHITPAIHACEPGADVNVVVKKNATLTAGDLLSRSEIIRKAVEDGDLTIMSTYYHLGSGEVEFI